jgi:hypothetical protein
VGSTPVSGWLTVSLVFALACAGRPLSAQDAPAVAPPPIFKPDARTLDRIRTALDREPALARPPEGLRFYLEINTVQRTWQDYMASARGAFAITPITPPADRPGGTTLGGVDLLSIFRRVNQARRDREARQIRERIDRELRALDAAERPRSELPP